MLCNSMVVTALRSHGGKNGRNTFTFVKQFELMTVTGCLHPARRKRSNMDAGEKKNSGKRKILFQTADSWRHHVLG